MYAITAFQPTNAIGEKCREANINLHMCFIDYSKAFDCVGHREMIEALKKMNCHYKITNLIINLYKE